MVQKLSSEESFLAGSASAGSSVVGEDMGGVEGIKAPAETRLSLESERANALTLSARGAMRFGTALKLLIDILAWGFVAALLAFALRLELIGKDYLHDALVYAAVVLPLKVYAIVR